MIIMNGFVCYLQYILFLTKALWVFLATQSGKCKNET